MKINFLIYLLFTINLFIVFLLKPPFDLNDGFFSEINYILLNGVSFDLSLIHAIRMVVLSPIIIYKLYGNSILLLLGVFIYTLPLYKYYLVNQKHFTNNMLLFFLTVLAFVFSERTFIALLGFLYLNIYYLNNKKALLLFYSFFISILSSGSLLVFLLLLIIFNNYVYKVSPVKKLLLFTIFSAPLSFSILNKISFFASQENGFISVILRSKIFESFIDANYLMFIFFLLMLSVIIIFIMILLVHNRSYQTDKIVILFLGTFTFLVEGLAVYTYIISLYFIIFSTLTLKKNA